MDREQLSEVVSAAVRPALWPWVAVVLGYGAMLAAGGRLLNDPDTYWHIVAGRWMIEHRMVPSQDPFSYTFQGAKWVPHEWLAEFLLAASQAAFGWWGVIAATALAIAATLGLLTAFLDRKLASRHALILAMMGLFVAAPHLLARPHVFAMPIMILWVGCLVAVRDRQGSPPWLLLPVMTLWANLHGGYSLGLALTFLFAIEAVWEAGVADRLRVAKAWAGFLLLATGAALLTPNGIDGLLFPIHLLGMKASLAAINEWRSPDFQHFQPVEVWLLAFIFGALAFGVRLPPLRIVMLMLLTHLALSHERSAELLGLLGPLIVAGPIAAQFALPQKTPSRNSLGVAFAAIALMFGATGVFAVSGEKHPNPGMAPEAALRAVSNAVSGPVFNAYEFGGYLIWEGRAPFIDGRVDLYGDAFFEDYAQAVDGVGEALPRLLDRYKVGWTLLPPQSPAVALLDLLPGWERIYADRTAVVHRRKLDSNP